MATKKKSDPQPTDAAQEAGTLEKAAKAIGSTLGTIAAKTGVAQPSHAGEGAPAAPKKRGKIVSQGKKRLPRKEKKRLQKAAAKTSGGQSVTQ